MSNRAWANTFVGAGLLAIAAAAFVLDVSAGLAVLGIESVVIGLGVLKNDR